MVLEQEKSVVASAVEEALEAHREVFTPSSVFGECLPYLKEYVTGGKLFRGSLYLAGCDALGVEGNPRVAAGIELLHSAMLVQDDVMDRDDTRRGLKAVHKELKRYSEHHAESLSTLVSDAFIFIAYNEFSNHPRPARCSRVASECLLSTVRGQSLDITAPFLELTREQCLQIHREKTGRYTFTMPLRMAYAHTDTSPDHLKVIGGLYGVLFQLRDDELNVYGDQKETGKPVMSDVVEGKQTVLRELVVRHDPSLKECFGDESAVERRHDDLRLTLDAVREEHEGIRDRFEAEAVDYVTETVEHESLRGLLLDVLEAVLRRDR